MKTVEVLLPKPFDHGFDYLVPDGVELGAGDYVRVPFGKQSVLGVVWGAGKGDVPIAKLKPIAEHFSHLPPMGDTTRQFIEWVARYTLSPRGMVLKMSLPVEESFAPKKEKLPKSKAGKKVVEELGEAFEKVDVQPIAKPPALSDAQREVTETIAARLDKGFSVTVIDGVTGSGKTEVYFDAIARVIEGRGQQAERAISPRSGSPCDSQEANHGAKQTLVLLPEIALSTQWVERCKARFGFEPLVWHSGLTPAKRRESLRAILTGEAKLVVGARSALFLPYANLGLIVVDEEHEQSYKQEDGVLYHARDMAVARAHVQNLPIVLVSATPSLETVNNLREGRYEKAHLPERHGGVHLPQVSLVDMRQEKLDSGTWVSQRLRAAIAETLSAKRQVMLFLNRRGYAPLLLCRTCGHRFACPECSSWMVLHGNKTKGQLRCHHCDHRDAVPKACPACLKEETLVACGPGVERVAEEVAALFPTARVEMMTSDTMDSLKVAEMTVQEMTEGSIDILVGTQMMAKGYHFPNLHLIGVIDADLGLQGGDLRAGERTYQLLHQVAGRAGREQEQGQVLLQTYLPDHPVMLALAAHDREGLEQLELVAREDAVLPPFGRLAALIIDGPQESDVVHACRQLSLKIPKHADIRVLGPAPAPLTRLRGRYRYRFLLRSPKRVALQPYVHEWLSQVPLPNAIRLRVDIDPYSFF
ncbi:MAG: primosomal protein N' [Alphaproteobacteria bacterium]|nr:primosomal protein N' [Alphaproteobacteria bacterium]